MIFSLLRAVSQNKFNSFGDMASYYGLKKGAGFQRRGRESAQTAADTICSNSEVVLSSNKPVAYRICFLRCKPWQELKLGFSALDNASDWYISCLVSSIDVSKSKFVQEVCRTDIQPSCVVENTRY